MSNDVSRFQRAEFANVWTVYQHISAFEHHFNTLQGTYRTLASTWLLAMFIGIGFVVSGEYAWGIQKTFVVSMVAIFTAFGLLILWIMDLLVYQKLLDAAFSEGVILERDFRWLPQVRHRMKLALPEWNAVHRTVWYYVGTTGAALAIAVISSTLGTFQLVAGTDGEVFVPLLASGAAAILGITISLLIEHRIIAASGVHVPEEIPDRG